MIKNIRYLKFTVKAIKKHLKFKNEEINPEKIIHLTNHWGLTRDFMKGKLSNHKMEENK